MEEKFAEGVTRAAEGVPASEPMVSPFVAGSSSGRRGVEVPRRASSRAAREGRPRLRFNVEERWVGAGVEGSVGASWVVLGEPGFVDRSAGVEVPVGVVESGGADTGAVVGTGVGAEMGTETGEWTPFETGSGGAGELAGGAGSGQRAAGRGEGGLTGVFARARHGGGADSTR